MTTLVMSGVFGALILAGATLPGFGQELGDYSDRLVNVETVANTTVSKSPVTVFASQDVDGAFNGVVVRARIDAQKPLFWVRFLSDDGEGEWQAMPMLHNADSPIVMAAFHRSEAVESGRFEIAVAPADAEIEILGTGVFDTRTDEDQAPPVWEGSISKRADAKGNIIPPRLYTRAEWGARPFIGTPEALARPRYDKLTLHHAACCAASTLEEGLEQVKGIQIFHQDGRGWSDIGYHFLLDQSGRVYQGRPFLDESIKFEDGPPLALGAHVGGSNTGNIGVSLLGCYHPSEGSGCRDQLSPQALDSLVTLWAYLSDTYGVTPSVLRGHRDYSSTACPGDNNYVLIPEIRRRVAELLEVGNQPVGTANLNATVSESGVVSLNWQFLTNLGITEFQIDRVSSSGRSPIYSSEGAVDLSIVDDQVGNTGEIRYELLARDANGRVQQLASVRVVIEEPAAYVLTEGFPNPFSAAASIRYYLLEDGFVNLRLYDSNGRVVQDLAEGFLEQGRWHTAHVDGTGLAAGTYFYRITVEGFSGIVFDDSQKIVVAR